MFKFHIVILLTQKQFFSLHVDLTKRVSIVTGTSPTTRGKNVRVGRRSVYMYTSSKAPLSLEVAFYVTQP